MLLLQSNHYLMPDLYLFYWYCHARVCLFFTVSSSPCSSLCCCCFFPGIILGTTPRGSSSSTPLLDYDCFWLERPCAKDGHFLLVATFALYSMCTCMHAITTTICVYARVARFSLVFSPLSSLLFLFLLTVIPPFYSSSSSSPSSFDVFLRTDGLHQI